MKLSVLDSRPLANEGVECKLYNPKTGKPLKAGIVMRGADSAVAKNKQKELAERHRLEGKQITEAMAVEDSIEILTACAIDWHDVEDEDTGKPLPFTVENMKSALAVPEIYKQVGAFYATRSNFLGSASAS